MTKLLRASDAASLAIHALVLIANEEELINTSQIADALEASKAHLAKVLNRLTKAGLVNATRGPKGGLALARPPEQIALEDIYKAVEGPLEIAGCIFSIPICDGSSCLLGRFFSGIADQVTEKMRETTLAQVCESLTGELQKSMKEDNSQ